MFTVNTCFLPHPSHKNPYAYTTHTHPLTPPTGEILWIILLSNWHSHGSLNFAILKPPLLSVDQALFFNKGPNKGQKKNNDFLEDHSLSPVCTAHVLYRQMDTQSIKPIQTSPRQHTFVFQSLLTPGGHLLIFQYLQISSNCSTRPDFHNRAKWMSNVNDCTTTEPNIKVLISLSSLTECEHPWLQRWECNIEP